MKSEGNFPPPAIPTLPMKEQVESEEEKLDKESPRRLMMAADCLRFELEPSPNRVAVTTTIATPPRITVLPLRSAATV